MGWDIQGIEMGRFLGIPAELVALRKHSQCWMTMETSGPVPTLEYTSSLETLSVRLMLSMMQ